MATFFRSSFIIFVIAAWVVSALSFHCFNRLESTLQKDSDCFIGASLERTRSMSASNCAVDGRQTFSTTSGIKCTSHGGNILSQLSPIIACMDCLRASRVWVSNGNTKTGVISQVRRLLSLVRNCDVTAGPLYRTSLYLLLGFSHLYWYLIEALYPPCSRQSGSFSSAINSLYVCVN